MSKSSVLNGIAAVTASIAGTVAIATLYSDSENAEEEPDQEYELTKHETEIQEAIEYLDNHSITSYIRATKAITSYKDLKCANSLLNDQEIDLNQSQIKTSLKSDDFHFKSGARGCLSVWWEKEEYKLPEDTNTYWKANWNLVLVIKGDINAIVMHNSLVAGETDNDNQIHVQFMAHRLKKHGDKWKLEAWFENTEGNTISDTDSESKNMIKPGDLVKNSGGERWGFNFDYQKICSSNETCKGNMTYSKGSKTWTLTQGTMHGKESAELIHEGWSSNHATWGSKGGIFPEYSSLKIMFKNIKSYFEEASTKQLNIRN